MGSWLDAPIKNGWMFSVFERTVNDDMDHIIKDEDGRRFARGNPVSRNLIDPQYHLLLAELERGKEEIVYLMCLLIAFECYDTILLRMKLERVKILCPYSFL